MEDITDPTWQKIVRGAEKAGYRDGVGDGKSAVFQNGFDQGYEAGFKNAFRMGRLKGALRANGSTVDNPDLEKTRRGNCVLCKDPSLEQKTLSEVAQLQADENEALMRKLRSAHAKDCVIPVEGVD